MSVTDGGTQAMADAEILEKLREYFQTSINNINGTEMAEGPFENEADEEFGDTWEDAATRIDARGGLRVYFRFADQERGRLMNEGTVPGIVTQATKLQKILDDMGVGRSKTEPEDQPMPIISDTEPFIHDRVAVDVAARGELGRKRYGTKLQAFNGRKPLQDAYEELLDAACYTLQAKTEVDALLAAWCALSEAERGDVASDLAIILDRLVGLA